MVNELKAIYEKARVGLRAGDPVAVLAIGPEQSAIAAGTGDVASNTVTLGIGARKMIRDQFNGVFPQALSLENSIAVVEDEIMKHQDFTTDSPTLVIFEASLLEVVLASGFPAAPRAELDLNAVERLFTRLSTVSYGGSPTHEGIPEDAEFAAKLLIVREVLHHMGFQSLSIGS